MWAFCLQNAYVLAHEQSNVKVLLQAQRYGIKQPGGEATDELVDSYRSMVVVKSGSDIKELADLKGKTIATQRCNLFGWVCLASCGTSKRRE